MSTPAHEGDALVEALRDCVETLALVEHPRREDPAYGETVKALGERIGYGVLMASAQASWRSTLLASGMAGGGEFVAGPCFATVVSTLAKARDALASASRINVEQEAEIARAVEDERDRLFEFARREDSEVGAIVACWLAPFSMLPADRAAIRSRPQDAT